MQHLVDRLLGEGLWNFPYAAIEKALVNAVYHRSYEEREPIAVRISNEARISKKPDFSGFFLFCAD
ncbi:MAG: hypothetical protein ACK4FP_09445 [Azonexus sp.]